MFLYPTLRSRDYLETESGLYLRVLYGIQLAFYLGDVFVLFASRRVRPDASVYLLHHICTLGLIIWSFVRGWTRSGLIVFGSHDLCDVFLHGGKLLSLLRWRSAFVVLAVFVVAFFLCRLVCLSSFLRAFPVRSLHLHSSIQQGDRRHTLR